MAPEPVSAVSAEPDVSCCIRTMYTPALVKWTSAVHAVRWPGRPATVRDGIHMRYRGGCLSLAETDLRLLTAEAALTTTWPCVYGVCQRTRGDCCFMPQTAADACMVTHRPPIVMWRAQQVAAGPGAGMQSMWPALQRWEWCGTWMLSSVACSEIEWSHESSSTGGYSRALQSVGLCRTSRTPSSRLSLIVWCMLYTCQLLLLLLQLLTTISQLPLAICPFFSPIIIIQLLAFIHLHTLTRTVACYSERYYIYVLLTSF